MTLFQRALLALALIFGLTAAPLAAHAELKIDISRGVTDPIPVAITDFYSADGGGAQIGRDISSVIVSNLERSGLFRQLDPQTFSQTPAQLQQTPNFANWKVIGAQGLISGNVTAQGGKYRVEFRLWDPLSGQQMAGMAYTTTQDNWRRIAHKISDVIYNRVTGETGYFDTRIVYVAESGPATARVKRLAMMDQDGFNHRFLTDGSALVLTPRFNPSSNEITFMSFQGNRPRVYVYNLDTGRQQILGDFPGMTFSPRFSPDGKSIVFSLINGGNSNIYVMNLASRQTKQLTNNPSINTSPSYSPDGSKIVFESDRGGKQQLYVMNADGSNTQRISFGEGSYGGPVWSPRGDLIAYTKIQGGQFYVGVLRPDGSGDRTISQSFHIEGPTWAPNGRVLAYFKDERNSDPKLYSIDLTGNNERQVVTPLAASDPAWSPLLP